MNRTKYWQNKILYALGKIDYAQSRMRRKENNNALSRIYAVLLSYGKDGCDLSTLMQLAKLNREEVVRHLKQLKEMGIADWLGRNLKESKKVKVNDVPSQKVYEGIHTDQFQEHLVGYGFDKDGAVILPKDVPVHDTEAHIKAAKHDDGWVEIRYSSDVILKVKKSIVREKLLDGA
jgi:hypothetical protein